MISAKGESLALTAGGSSATFKSKEFINKKSSAGGSKVDDIKSAGGDSSD
jgi:hypothetical protein